MATFLHVPAGTTPTRCKSCNASVYVVAISRGKLVAVSCGVPGGSAPTKTAGGQGVPHRTVCADVDVAPRVRR